MKINILRIIVILMGFMLSMNVLAHGDHTKITPEHSLEHVVFYMGGLVAAVLLYSFGKKAILQRKK